MSFSTVTDESVLSISVNLKKYVVIPFPDFGIDHDTAPVHSVSPVVSDKSQYFHSSLLTIISGDAVILQS
jgi:hypothetical protein